METQPGFSLTHEERVALTFIAHNDPRDGFVRRTWLEFKTAICGLLQRTRAGGWIPVSERLPETRTNVLAYDGNLPHSVTSFRVVSLSIDGSQWFDQHTDEEHPVNVFTHWMPLPEPPRVK